MSDQTSALAIAPSLDNALARIEEPQLIRLAALAKRSVVVGAGEKRRAINDNEASALALISMATGASFVNGELYLTDTGPMFGVPLYERKADEYMWALLPGTSYHIHYRAAQPGVDAMFDPGKGDVASVATLTRDDWDTTWKKNYSEYFTLLVGAGAPWADANTYALQMAGPKPCLEFVGVVDGRESFSGDEYKWDDKLKQNVKTGQKKPEMFDRIERAQKRARKGVLKHGFPRLNIPEPAEIMAKPQAAKLVEVVVREIPKIETGTLPTVGIVSDTDGAERRILATLGYDTPDEPTQNKPTPEVPTMTLPTALAVVSPAGVLYADMDDATLSKAIGGLRSGLVQVTDPQKKEEAEYRLSAALVIQADRAKKAQ